LYETKVISLMFSCKENTLITQDQISAFLDTVNKSTPLHMIGLLCIDKGKRWY